MTEVLMVVAQEIFRDEEYLDPKEVLESHGAHVVTASRSAGKSIGKLGAVVDAQLSLTESTHRTWDAVIFVGGAGASTYFDDPEAHALARAALENGVLAAICIAPSILARAGLLEGVQATAFASQKADLLAHGAIWRDKHVVTEGKIVTADGPDAAHEFGNAIADLLGI